jgi:hypothetical protein
VFDAVFVTEAEITGEIGSNGIGVENNSIEQAHSRVRLSGARQPHDQNLAPHI